MTGPICGVEVELRLRPRIFILLLLIDTTCDFGHITPPVAATRSESHVPRKYSCKMERNGRNMTYKVSWQLLILSEKLSQVCLFSV